MEHKEVALPSASVPESRIKFITHKGRSLPPNYHSVVIARWLHSLKKLNKYFKLIDRKAYYETYETYIKAIIYRPNVSVRIAALEEDVDVIFGWAVFEGDTLHYVHVNEPYRKKQLSYDLIPSDIKYMTHVTKHWEDYFMKNPKNKFSHVQFNPFKY